MKKIYLTKEEYDKEIFEYGRVGKGYRTKPMSLETIYKSIYKRKRKSVLLSCLFIIIIQLIPIIVNNFFQINDYFKVALPFMIVAMIIAVIFAEYEKKRIDNIELSKEEVDTIKNDKKFEEIEPFFEFAEQRNKLNNQFFLEIYGKFYMENKD